LTEIAILSIFAVSFNLLWGQTGLLSFGHALFLGSGAYLSGHLIVEYGLPIIAVILLVIIASAGIALVIGLVSLRLSGVYFAIITLAFSQLFYLMSIEFREVTGGMDGMTGIYRPSLLGQDLILLNDQFTFYQFVVVINVFIVAYLYLLTHSMFGRILRAIRYNEERTTAIGVNTFRVKVVAFVIASTIGAISGVLWTLFTYYASPATLHWAYSGDALIYTLIGGVESLFGPIFGAGFIIWIQSSIFRTEPGLWNIAFGVILVAVVLLSPRGLVGIGKSLLSLRKHIPFDKLRKRWS
jgi:branched-chain amino acid transport system permease protein